MHGVTGLHHVTAISGPAQENLDFYSGVLGMRLVKKSVNQDDPGTYHLFYADATGSPGSDLTFFPWEQLAPSRMGHGLATEVALTVAPEALDFWGARLERYGVTVGREERRFGERVLPFTDPHGLALALVEHGGREAAFEPWTGSPVAAEHQVRGLHGARVWERDLAPTVAFITRTLGLVERGSENGWTRFGAAGGEAGALDLRVVPEGPRGQWGVGSVHHLAWRVADRAHQDEVRERVEAAGRQPTPVIDRFWFASVYFKEPGGVLFELATDGPGFAADEDPAHLGERLVLPPWLERSRREIESRLPPLHTPVEAAER